jgi:hypothetical protein
MTKKMKRGRLSKMFKFNRGRFVKEIEATSAKRKKPVFWLVLNKLVRFAPNENFNLVRETQYLKVHLHVRLKQSDLAV